MQAGIPKNRKEKIASAIRFLDLQIGFVGLEESASGLLVISGDVRRFKEIVDLLQSIQEIDIDERGVFATLVLKPEKTEEKALCAIMPMSKATSRK